ncbi:carbon storage regulator, CsrA [Curtobacterium sp. UNCCL20]|uniref:carbon storage regulator CsrA n=1 Tax=Curtobacterium sp. UNCCL20 TaxID=1502773 RepID=UPI000885FC8C|nr:carbon storage regulator CsrA [Curtobacterium sp. UNCCL20]SDQ99789.1 carbon storage regulator, CsrA [Curtobacterium sp. UNCCL20]
MLVLTRKVGERILVGDDIVITVLDSRGDGVRIGIDAPRGVKIQREEVVRAVTEANAEAAAAAGSASDAAEAASAEARLRQALGELGAGSTDSGAGRGD